MEPIVKATFQTRCGCIKEFTVPYPPPPQYYFPLKREPFKMWLQDELSQLPVCQVRVFGLTHYGHIQEREEGVIHVLYEELTEQRTKRYTEDDLRWGLAMLLTRIENRFKPSGALAMEEAIDIAKELLGEPRPDATLDHLFELWKQGHKVEIWAKSRDSTI